MLGYRKELTWFMFLKVDRHPEFRNSRCLFVVRTDGVWIDFSYQKCLRAYIREKYPSHAGRFIREHFKRGWRFYLIVYIFCWSNHPRYSLVIDMEDNFKILVSFQFCVALVVSGCGYSFCSSDLQNLFGNCSCDWCNEMKYVGWYFQHVPLLNASLEKFVQWHNILVVKVDLRENITFIVLH